MVKQFGKLVTQEQILNVNRFSVMLKIQHYFTAFIHLIYKYKLYELHKKLTEVYKCLKIVHHFMLAVELTNVNIFNLIVKFNQILYKFIR